MKQDILYQNEELPALIEKVYQDKTLREKLTKMRFVSNSIFQRKLCFKCFKSLSEAVRYLKMIDNKDKVI